MRRGSGQPVPGDPATWTGARSVSIHDGFAREIGADRVPDEIRLQTRRGGQSWDEWIIMHDQRDRYEAEVGLMETTSTFGDFIYVDRLRETMRGLPWGDPRGGWAWRSPHWPKHSGAGKSTVMDLELGLLKLWAEAMAPATP